MAVTNLPIRVRRRERKEEASLRRYHLREREEAAAQRYQQELLFERIRSQLTDERREWFRFYCNNDTIKMKMAELLITMNDMNQRFPSPPSSTLSSIVVESKESIITNAVISPPEWSKSVRKGQWMIISGHKKLDLVNNKAISGHGRRHGHNDNKNGQLVRQHLRYYFAFSIYDNSHRNTNTTDKATIRMMSLIGSSTWSRCSCIWLVWSFLSRPHDICHVQVTVLNSITFLIHIAHTRPYAMLC
jgi:hypothetical protein